jgi:hypothetical protein
MLWASFENWEIGTSLTFMLVEKESMMPWLNGYHGWIQGSKGVYLQSQKES